MKRWIGVILAAVLAGVAVVAVVAGNRGEERPAVAVVRGVIGSEKKPFFDDPRVRAAFARHGLRVEVDTAGSRQIVTDVDLGRYAFAFPSSVPAAERIKRDRGATVTYSPFYSPMAVATFEPIAGLLAKAGVLSNSGKSHQTLDIKKYLELVAKGTRWDEIPGNSAYKARKRVLLTTTDIRTSNSAAMYLSVIGYVANGEDVITSDAQIARIAPVLAPAVLDQGFSESTSEASFDDYLALGAGKTPMLVVYEAQYLAHVFAGDGAIKPDMRLVYPSPTVLSKHTLVPLSAAGDRVGRLLTEDPELQSLAATYGFRTTDPRAFAGLVAKTGAPAAADLVDVVEPPTYERLDRLITTIDAARP
ncbi:hypothetical protein BKM31_06605 [[Actinomadura] parvosata subsp. kistnae]|uniref:Extracellular solute-binding protein n=1 Tax=[Actinomadura] parvosata subsp. kistnae TaxID=1909395 RepID=A0A1U9ZTB4_9ACTN|nr:hypothetical protein [Nonomuraea sp. ATCC 55076]AQZ61197.1 hypothetical protein BKM31_06605 [Nonomuraea sp. ATCC 55076]